MGIISCETPESEFTMFQPVKGEDISSAKLLEAAKFNDSIKVYSKPSKSKFKQLVLKKISNSNLESTTYQKLDLYWIFCSLFMKNAPNWHDFMANIINGKHLSAQVKYHPNILLDPSSYDAIYSTMFFVRQQIKQKRICCTSFVTVVLLSIRNQG